jgi:hypothetical protein
VLEFLLKENVPFAVFAYPPWNEALEVTVVGGHGVDKQSYRCNPGFPSDMGKRVWLSVVSHMLPRYS